MRKSKKIKDLAGMIFGRLTVLPKYRRVPFGKKKVVLRTQWRVLCKCGKRKWVHSNSLLHGDTTSCGCLAAERAAETRRSAKKLSAVERVTRAQYHYVAKNARERGLEFSLSRGQVAALLRGDCYYCGSPPSRKRPVEKRAGSAVFINGIDRFDNNLGYTIDNCVTACWRCNKSKSNWIAGDFIKWALSFADNQRNKRVVSFTGWGEGESSGVADMMWAIAA